MSSHYISLLRQVGMMAAVTVVVATGMLLRPLATGVFSSPVKVPGGGAYSRHGRTVRTGKVVVIAAGPGDGAIIQVPLTLTTDEHWQISPSDVILRLRDGTELPALPPSREHPETSLVFGPGTERTAVLRFAANGAEVAAAELRLLDPRARFALESG